MWPLPQSRSAGTSLAQRSVAWGQRLLKGQPFGRSSTLGTSPFSPVKARERSTAGSAMGTAESRVFV